MSLVKKIRLSVVLLVLLVTALAFLVGTTSGLHFLLNGAARLIPGLEIAYVSGGWRDLTIKHLRYQIPGITVSIGEFHLALELSSLCRRQLCLNDLSMRDVNIGVNTAECGPPIPITQVKLGAGPLSTPYPINLRCITLNKVQVKLDNILIDLDALSTGFQFQGNNLIITPMRITGLLVALPSSTQVVVDKVAATSRTIKPKIYLPKKKIIEIETKQSVISALPMLTKKLRELFAKPLLPRVTSFTLPLNLTVENIEVENLLLISDVSLLITRLRLQAATRDQRAELTLLDIDSPQGWLNASGNAELSGRWPVIITINTIVNSAPLKGEKIKLAVGGYLLDELHAALNLSGPLTAQLMLKMRLSEAGLPLTMMLNSESAQWPLTGTPQYQVRGLALKLNGEVQDYRLTLKAGLSGMGLPPADVILDAQGNTDRFILSRLRLATLHGNTDLSAVVDWQHAICWSSELSLSGINTASQWPAWPARLDGKITSCGCLYGEYWQLKVSQLDLHGHILKNSLTAKGSLSGNSVGEWQVPELFLVLGRNQITVKGELNDALSLDAIINAPTLSGTLPELDGRVLGNIKLRGNMRSPQLLIDLDVHALRWRAVTIGRIALQGIVCYGDIVRGNIQLRLYRFIQGSLSIAELTMNSTGNENQHQLKIEMHGDPISGQLHLNGGFDRQQQRWQGTLNQTHFDTPLGEWQLARAMTLDYQTASQHLIIGPHFWLNSNAQICAPQNIEVGASGQASLVLNHFDLAMLKLILPKQTQTSGVFNGRVDICWTSVNGLPQGKMVLVGKGVKVDQTVQGKTISVNFEMLTFSAALDKGLICLDWLINIAGNGQLSGQVQVTDLKNRRELSGNVNINHLSLALLNPLISRNGSVDGLVNAALRLDGSVWRPEFYGQLGIERIVIKGNFMPITMTESQLALLFAGACSTLHGTINTTHGQVNLTGEADWSQMVTWRARINAQGNRVRITVPPIVRLDLSPDIMFEATPTLFALTGKVDIPWARIEVNDMPKSAVNISSDELFLNDNLQPVDDRINSTFIPISLNLLVHVGDGVRFNAFGLKAKLKGDLKVVQDKQVLGLNGQIDIPSGRFHAYGQDLIVNKGQLLFSGPVDQPYLNIEAIRNPDSTEDEVTAGIRVTGLADQPKLEVFSNPVKSQQEALSYLLRGQSLNASNADSNMMTSMLLGLGIAQSGQVMGKIGQAFGVSDLALDTQGVGDSSQVVVSGYIAPNLQVKYGVGIFDSLATLTIRYRLSPKLYLEAVSGLHQAINLLYRFEF
ncbi:autotransporter assembly complex protein TamB [Sodalis endosymbiont of Henestaris halophilus]|uniref:autotransporter assembly complex protein TamB n=1 Tax=Sodalis endosymbiont of Henestaris halophilus TaxID=1929246 RepID=UPI000BBF949C|nr:translocation/assembly module TamB domain-containing protein [Sodalis endosymbiont of Henestaris halophilus]SNC58696.1 Translocation and assembly module TamB [Sodalis endosymbiont of Henestaris halophilus]